VQVTIPGIGPALDVAVHDALNRTWD
jgi:hypothetical protein